MTSDHPAPLYKVGDGHRDWIGIMAEGSNKQVVINQDLHRRLRIHVATLGITSIKAYVESIIEHAIATNNPPESVDPVDATEDEPIQIEPVINTDPAFEEGVGIKTNLNGTAGVIVKHGPKEDTW